MAGMFYNLQEVIEKLGKSEDEIKELIRDGKLREFRDGSKQLFKIDEVDNFVAEVGESEIDLVLDETGEISLEDAPEQPKPKSEGGFNLSNMGDLTAADTNIGTTGISVLGETDDGYKLAEDSKAETQAQDASLSGELGSLDSDANMESFGSGSGLLDLSLQADDTSLGAVLDDILPAAGEGDAEGIGLEEAGIDEEADKIFEDKTPEPVAAEPAAMDMSVPRGAPVFVEPEPTAVDNAYGISLLAPLVAMIFTIIIVFASAKNVVPGILEMTGAKKWGGAPLIWYIAGGLFVLMLLIIMIGSVVGGKGKKKKAQA
jgi:hypothetical protein